MTNVRVDYHLHTCHSPDSDASLDEILERAAAASIDRLCVTDHDTIDGALALARLASPDLTIVVGCEFSTDDGAQVVGLHLREMISARRLPELLAAIRGQGGSVLLPHPFRRGSGVFRPEVDRPSGFVEEILGLTDLVECYNGRDSMDNNRRNLEFVLERGLRGVASSDAHRARDIGSVFVEYLDPAPVDGVTTRSIFFPDRVSRGEAALKRSVMERYHRHRGSMPRVVDGAYQRARRLKHRLSPQPVPGKPRAQYDFVQDEPVSAGGA